VTRGQFFKLPTGTAVLLLLAWSALSGQWAHYPTAGVPRTPSGIPNLGAPTPRTADGKPDLSGMWEAENTLPCDPVNQNCTDLPVGIQFANIGARIKGGLPYQPWAAELVKKNLANQEKDDPTIRCLPAGVPRTHAAPTLKKFVQTPGLLVLLDEYNASFRQIFTDGRPLPVDPNPTFDGYSTGHWDGDTLVVDSIGFTERQWLDSRGSPITEAAKITERFHRINYGNMEIEVTVNDPKAYTAPWTVKLNQYIVLNTELIDYFCLENEKDAEHIK
jgi:hypothetical protein